MSHQTEHPVERLGEQFCNALRALGAAGQPHTASEIAAKAWWATRYDAPRVAARINATMHHLARLPDSDPPSEDEEPTVNDTELDVRQEAPARRHDLILSTYEGLEGGTGFVLVNDHDPKPLYYQFAAEYPEQFTWDYLESGPEVWKVRIGRPAVA